MNMTNLAALLREDMTTVAVLLHPNYGEYTFKCPRSIAATLQEGDIVAVNAHSSSNIKNEATLGLVSEVHDEPQFDMDLKKPYKWIICKVPLDEVMEKQKKDQEVGERLSAQKMKTCRDQALHALGLSPEDAKKLLK